MRAVLVERCSRSEYSRLEELSALTRTLGYEVAGFFRQIRDPDPAYQIGRGKAGELAEFVKAKGAELVIFSNQLTPSQAFKLSQLLRVEVIDRLQLILRIFAMRAGSLEAKLQIEYARLNYELPRVRERVRALMSVEQPGLMGGGEYEVNVHYDALKRRMVYLKKKLRSLEKTREQRRKLRRRRGFKLVALAGYTNAGKSTLLNGITSSNAEVDDMLFTTLTPRTRAIKKSRKILLTDTVGFIDGLPPWMIEAFKATLEEIYLADLVLLVLDAAEPLEDIVRKFRTSREVLAEYPVKVVTVMNKIDLLPPEKLGQRLELMKQLSPHVVPISALKRVNLPSLLELVRKNIFGRELA